MTESRTSTRGLAFALAVFWTIGGHAEEVVNVRTTALGQVMETPVHSAPASVVARNTPQVAAEIAARVIALPVQVGDRVEPGDEIARLDCRRHESLLAAARAALARAEARQRFARRQLNRARNLQKKKSISEELLDQRRTDLAVNQADTLAAQETAEQAALDVDHCVVRSPLNAVVSERLVSVGSHVTAGVPLVGLIETIGPEVTVALRQDQLPGFEAAAVRTFEHNGEILPLTLRTVLPAADTITRTREARLGFAADAAIPGTPGRVVWRDRVASVPADYLVRREGRLGIFLLDGDRATFFAIPAAQEGRSAPVEGLSMQTRLITEGRQRLADGDRVNRADDE